MDGTNYYPKNRDPILAAIVQKFDRRISRGKLILFGSRARGVFRDRSDYDLAVAGAADDEFNQFFMDMTEPDFTLLKIDVVNQSHLSDDFKKVIAREGNLLYEKP